MLIPFSWLKEFVEIKKPAEKIADELLLAGTKVEEIIRKNNEIIFNFEITPNRADTLSLLGIAREVAAITGKVVTLPPMEPPIFGKLPTKKINLNVKNKKLCPFYSVVVLENLTVKSSPEWIKNYLQECQIRPINNVVDITNLVMLELGAPMHAFDKAKLKGELSLRESREGESLTTLDGVNRKLPPGSIIIEDEEKIIDLAGLMGGENSQIDTKTASILLHVPFYDPVAIRKTSLAVNLRTEASNRFEKKLDPNLHVLAINRAINLLIEEASAVFGSQITSVGYPVKENSLEFNEKKVRQILGIDLSTEELINLLTPLGFQVKRSNLKENTLQILVPTYRADIAIEEDILEEIGRIFGYNNFPKTLPEGKIPIQKETFEPDVEKEVREFLLQSLFSETMGYTLVSEEDLHRQKINPETTLKVLHPTSRDFVYLRPTLLINALKAAVINEKESFSFFEIGKEFKKEIDPQTKLPEQKNALVLVSTKSYFEIKSVLETLLNTFDLDLNSEAITNDSEISQGVAFYERKKLIAKIGTVRKDLLSRWEVKKPLVFAWVNFEDLKTKSLKQNYQPRQKYPSVIEDISLFVKSDFYAETIKGAVEKMDKLVTQVAVVDVFRKNSKKSLTLRLNFADPMRTLTNEEVRLVREKIIKKLVKTFSAEVRKD